MGPAVTDGCPTASGACVHGLAGQGNLEFEFKYKFPEQARLLEELMSIGFAARVETQNM